MPESSPDVPLILFAPGAGAPSTSDWMQDWAARLGTLGRVVRFDYPYRREGRRLPDRLPVLVSAHRQALDEARAGHPGPVFLAGKSMGGRVGCHVSLETPVDGLICFGYPLKSPGKSAARRDQVLRALTVPILFVQGTRDALCPLAELTALVPQLRARHRLHVVEGGDHSLALRRADVAATERTQDEVDAEILAAVARFVAAP